MKTLQICTGYDLSYNGGITNYVRNLSEGLTKKGHDVTVLYSKKNRYINKYTYKTISVTTQLNSFHLSSVLSNLDIIKIEKVIIKEAPKIIHVHMMIDLPIKILEMFAKHAKLVISLHDYYYLCNRVVLIKPKTGENCLNSHNNKDCNFCIEKHDTIDNKYTKRINLFIKKMINKNSFTPSNGHNEKFILVREIFRNVNGLIAVSNRVKEIYEINNFTNNNFIVKHIGNYTADNNFRKQFFKKIIINDNAKIRFGFIGNLNKIKGAEIFLYFSKNSTHEFHVYGRVDKDIKVEIDKSGNIFYHGEYAQEELIDILKKIDIGMVLPIWEDNAPQVVFEFLNAGIPILGTKIGGLPDFINESNGILFKNNDVELGKILKFINSDEIYKFYNNSINNIKGTKKTETHIVEMIDFYNKL